HRLGLEHALSVSGLHLSWVSAAAYALSRSALRRSAWLAARWDTRRLALVPACVAALGYSALAGWAVPVRRSVLVVLAAGFAVARRRPQLAGASLCAAALWILAAEPDALFAPGAQLSFAAMAAFVWALRRPAGERRVARALRTSAPAIAATAPVVPWHRGGGSSAALAADATAPPVARVRPAARRTRRCGRSGDGAARRGRRDPGRGRDLGRDGRSARRRRARPARARSGRAVRSVVDRIGRARGGRPHRAADLAARRRGVRTRRAARRRASRADRTRFAAVGGARRGAGRLRARGGQPRGGARGRPARPRRAGRGGPPRSAGAARARRRAPGSADRDARGPRPPRWIARRAARTRGRRAVASVGSAHRSRLRQRARSRARSRYARARGRPRQPAAPDRRPRGRSAVAAARARGARVAQRALARGAHLDAGRRAPAAARRPRRARGGAVARGGVRSPCRRAAVAAPRQPRVELGGVPRCGGAAARDRVGAVPEPVRDAASRSPRAARRPRGADGLDRPGWSGPRGTPRSSARRREGGAVPLPVGRRPARARYNGARCRGQTRSPVDGPPQGFCSRRPRCGSSTCARSRPTIRSSICTTWTARSTTRGRGGSSR